jgi:4'-phosphopantetheinyl transferase EntD
VSSPTEVHGIFDKSVIVLTSEIEPDAIALLTAREAELVARAVSKRQREFATGRMLARNALSRLGRQGIEILSGPGRDPIWPEGIRGSISHCNTRAVVAVSERTTSIGIDVEHRGELQPELWKMVLLPDEVQRLEREFRGADRGRMALALFSAKEAFYKAQYPWTGRFLGFEAVRVDFEPESSAFGEGRLACTLQVDVPPFPRSSVFHGRYRVSAFASGELLTGVQIER